MQPNAHGWCYSYYGTWNVSHKPKLGIVYFMLDEHVKEMVRKEKEKFQDEMTLIMNKFEKSLKCLIEKHSEKIENINIFLTDLSKLVNGIIDLNELEKPKIENKNKNRNKVVAKVKPKSKIEDEGEDNEDDFDNGYL